MNIQILDSEAKGLFELILALAMILGLRCLLKRIFSRSKKANQTQEEDWLSSIHSVILQSLSIFSWILLAALLGEFVVRYFGEQTKNSYIAPLRNIGIIASAAWFFLRLKTIFQQAAFLRKASGKPSLEVGSIEIIGKFFTILILFISLSLTLQIFGFDISLLITFGGIGVAALAFATKDVIANFYGGLMIQMSRSFTIHDQIELPQKNILGNVEKIGWYFTTIQDVNKKPVYIPNALFSTECVVNLSRMTHRCIDEVFYLRLKKMEKADGLADTIRQFLKGHPSIDANQPIHVHVMTSCPFSVHLKVKAYSRTTNYEKFIEIKHSILLKIFSFIEQAGGTASSFPENLPT